MKITFLGHSGFRIEAGDHVLLLDPWLRGNPVFDESRFDDAIAGATHILLSHAHSDHAGDAPEIAKHTALRSSQSPISPQCSAATASRHRA